MPGILPGKLLQWYIICALADTIYIYIYIFASVLNNYQSWISSIIARDDNLIKSDAKKCQQPPTCISHWFAYLLCNYVVPVRVESTTKNTDGYENSDWLHRNNSYELMRIDKR